MRRKQAFKRGRVLSIVVAGFAGYVIGGWNGSVPRSPALSAAQSVALRFPQDLDDASPVTMAFATVGERLGDGQYPACAVQSAAHGATGIGSASTGSTGRRCATAHAASDDAGAHPRNRRCRNRHRPAKRPNGIKPAAAAVHNRDDRAAGLMLNDAQIASIKTRLHLTPDQEQMWPAVEAALRNIAYTRSRDARRRGAPANTQVASADADGVDVRDLKSAAIPLIMSFNSEQKDEVRNLAHVMGLDQLATQF